MKHEAKYLRVTIHDNDFSTSLLMMGELLYNIFQYECKYPTEKDFPILKDCIKHLWLATDIIKDLMRWGKINSPSIDYFEPDLEFVNYLDILDWDNSESIYIPMFDHAEILSR